MIGSPHASENLARLAGCRGPHSFFRIGHADGWDIYRCGKCLGEVSGDTLRWYLAGLRHGKALSLRARAEPGD